MPERDRVRRSVVAILILYAIASMAALVIGLRCAPASRPGARLLAHPTWLGGATEMALKPGAALLEFAPLS